MKLLGFRGVLFFDFELAGNICCRPAVLKLCSLFADTYKRQKEFRM